MTNAGETYVIVRHSDLVQWQYSLNLPFRVYSMIMMMMMMMIPLCKYQTVKVV